ncbi:uncharacterized protein F5891DRAFT_1188398 [Suillus fuscotomentosus]|uniref:G domain-containing protein n=1 Tax=Suillus fuscotomentosus TaxID=1912939 RepID=A0AAD4E677_9AGAM|nr:uncharacterized protein F5891DRAFT_1188398 [Suillus fuscotomentosus]KAG1900490.1 hypothetical protein F5891DRAFT_1188398 [Suillus fuscotomentosus]
MATIDTQDLRERIERFRVLIIGRANAGKTTILQKVSNTTDEPEIYDAKGNKVQIDAAIVNSSIGRGNHDITNEMLFKGNPSFVFHDSCGFEAGSKAEFENMKGFISERARDEIGGTNPCYLASIVSQWTIRVETFQRLEEKFFLECNIRHVPVVAVFTKFKALRPHVYGEIKKQLEGLSGEERSKRIAQRVEELFTKMGVFNELCEPENRTYRKSYVRLENMNKLNTNCNILLEHTTLALDDEELRLCLLSTQQPNFVSSVPLQHSSIVHISNSGYLKSILKSISIASLVVSTSQSKTKIDSI